MKLFSMNEGEKMGILSLFGLENQGDYSIVSNDFTVLYVIKS